MRKLLDFLNRPAPRGNFFARAVNAAPFQILVCLLITAVVVAAAVNEYATNKYLNAGSARRLRSLLPCRPRFRPRSRLPLLPQLRRQVFAFQRPDDWYLLELP